MLVGLVAAGATVLAGLLVYLAPPRAHLPGGPAPQTDSGRPLEPAIAAEARVAAPAGERPRSISLGGRGEITLERDTVARLATPGAAAGVGPRIVELQRGRLLADVATRAADEPLSIITPHVVVLVVGTRFTVAVDSDATDVTVEHGRVRVERDGRSVFVGAGESLRSDDRRFTPPVAAPARTAAVRPSSRGGKVRSCTAAASSSDRASCLRRVARGTDLAAENALVALALLERTQHADRAAALARLEEYERRFPGGTLTREVALLTVRTLVESGAQREACAYAERYAARLPEDHVTLARLHASCTR